MCTLSVSYRNVSVGSLSNSLGIGTRIGNDDQTGLSEFLGDVIRKSTGGPTTRVSDGTDVLGELEDGTGTFGMGGVEDCKGRE